jgi:hypothetical protein
MSAFLPRIALAPLLFALGCAVAPGNAGPPPVEIRQAESFADVVREVNRLNRRHGPGNVLVVLDIDNTILTGTVDLGGDIWYGWQRGRLEVKPSPGQEIPDLFNGPIGLLFELAPMALTEETIPATVAAWQKGGNPVMALTSRAPAYRSPTERELSRHGITFEATAPAPPGQPPPVYRAVLDREYSYMKGILMVTGMHKGRLLEHLLGKVGRQYPAVVFVDDSPRNIQAMRETLEGNRRCEAVIFHYTRVEAERVREHGTVLTREQADRMDADWKKLNAVLEEIFPARAARQP